MGFIVGLWGIIGNGHITELLEIVSTPQKVSVYVVELNGRILNETPRD